MRTEGRTINWQGRAYWFERIEQPDADRRGYDWVVSRGGEFLGIMSCPERLTPMAFKATCARWLGEPLIGPAGAARHLD